MPAAPADSRRPRRRPPSRPSASAIAIGSVGGSPNSSVATKRPDASAMTTPRTTPTATSTIDSRITSRSTSCRCAPSAMRMPISLVRRATLYDISPKSPIAASTQRQRAEQRVRLREQLLPAANRFSTCSSCVERPSSADSGRSGGRPRGRPPRRSTGSPAVRTSKTAPPARLQIRHVHRRRRRSRTLLYSASLSTPTTSIWPDGFDARAESPADRILVREVLLRCRFVDHATFGALALSRVVEATAEQRAGFPSSSKKFGEMTSRLMLSCRCSADLVGRPWTKMLVELTLPRQQRRVRHGDGANAGHGGNALQQSR